MLVRIRHRFGSDFDNYRTEINNMGLRLTHLVCNGQSGLFDFRVAPNPNFMLDVNLEVEFDN